ncbi:MAG: nucleotidyltransferase substrate binding protein [Fibromonadaceae bacterium]|jgi:nucleotidyltransferase substrate binding protein (TIGR01987 family)|nr:nucleotidyltransferase substrate binding protein [Fibromonadaceae bacterium]
MTGPLDISSLANAINALAEGIEIYKESKENSDTKINTLNTLQAGVIQNFEVAYELSWKFMKRWLEKNINPNITLGISRKEFYRIAKEHQLISDSEKWLEFHEARNETSHSYDKEIADDVLKISFEFLNVAKKFFITLESKQ